MLPWQDLQAKNDASLSVVRITFRATAFSSIGMPSRRTRSVAGFTSCSLSVIAPPLRRASSPVQMEAIADCNKAQALFHLSAQQNPQPKGLGYAAARSLVARVGLTGVALRTIVFKTLYRAANSVTRTQSPEHSIPRFFPYFALSSNT